MPLASKLGTATTVLYVLALLAIAVIVIAGLKWLRGAALTPMQTANPSRRRMVSAWDEAGRRMEAPPPEETPGYEPPKEDGER